MSDLKTVKVASVEVKTGGGEDGKKSWTKFALVDGNENRCSTFDLKIGKFLQEHIGKTVDITVEQDGKFTNLLSASEHVEAPKTNGNGNGYARDPETEMRIAREACLKVAVQITSSADPKRTFPTPLEVIKVADVFVRWVYSGMNAQVEALVAPKNVDPTREAPAFDPESIPF